MTNAQLYLSIGVQIVPALIGITLSLAVLIRMGSIEKSVAVLDIRVSDHGKRFDMIAARFDDVNKRFDKIDARFDEVIAVGNRNTLKILRAMTALHERVAVVESKQQ